MLVLSRNIGERIFVGKDIIVSIEAIQGGRVRVGIEAPKEVRIYREELSHLQDDFEGGDMRGAEWD